MNLPDFTNDVQLIQLENRLGARYTPWTPSFVLDQVDALALRKRLEQQGEVEIELDGVSVNPVDNTLEFFGIKVLVYIRDQRHFKDYKFHVANCKTLVDSREQNRYERYVASTKSSGVFFVNKLDGGSVIRSDEMKLNVCKNCLDTINFNGYHSSIPAKKNAIYQQFSLVDYFEKYRSTSAPTPMHTDLTSPMNSYVTGFDAVARRVKTQAHYHCDICAIDLSSMENRRYLHVHHINGRKNDNSQNNLRPLCIKCHSTQPGHSMASHPDYQEFERRFGVRNHGVL